MGSQSGASAILPAYRVPRCESASMQRSRNHCTADDQSVFISARQPDLDPVSGSDHQQLLDLSLGRRRGGCRSLGDRDTALEVHLFQTGRSDRDRHLRRLAALILERVRRADRHVGEHRRFFTVTNPSLHRGFLKEIPHRVVGRDVLDRLAHRMIFGHNLHRRSRFAPAFICIGG